MNKLILLFLICLCSFHLYSQNPIILVNSDSVVGYKINEKPVRDFIGNVHLRQGNVDLFCNKATHYIEDNRAFLSGSVKITQDTLVLTSENVDYDGNKSLANAFSKIMIIDPSTKLTANKGTYNFRTKTADFFGDVVYEEQKSKLKAEHIEYNKPLQLIKSYGKVELETDSLHLKSDSMFIYRNEDKIFSVSNVQMSGKFELINLISEFLIIDKKSKILKKSTGEKKKQKKFWLSIRKTK
jgi:lipopolysaccharide export system protein LptA